jgi:hypothetical protein
VKGDGLAIRVRALYLNEVTVTVSQRWRRASRSNAEGLAR